MKLRHPIYGLATTLDGLLLLHLHNLLPVGIGPLLVSSSLAELPHISTPCFQKWQAGWLWVCSWVTLTSTKRQPNPLSYLPWYALPKGIFYFWAAPQGYRFKWGGTRMMFDRGVQHVVATTLLDHVFVSNIDFFKIFLGTNLDAT